MKHIYGIHLLIDGYSEDSKTLDPGNVCDMFDVLVKELDMQYLMRPIAMKVSLDENKLQTGDDEGGWSVISMITTSHISAHLWPLRKAFMMDIFSCKPFNADRATIVIKNFLDIKKINVKIIERNDPYML